MAGVMGGSTGLGVDFVGIEQSGVVAPFEQQ